MSIPCRTSLKPVYGDLLKLARVRFLLADDAGTGKTIMAGLLIKELKLRGMCEQILIGGPGQPCIPVAAGTQGKVRREVLRSIGFRHPRPVRRQPWLEERQLITSLDLAKRTEGILPGLHQVHWDLIIVDKAHRMSWSPPARKTARYALGELLREH